MILEPPSINSKLEPAGIGTFKINSVVSEPFTIWQVALIAELATLTNLIPTTVS